METMVYITIRSFGATAGVVAAGRRPRYGPTMARTPGVTLTPT